MRILSFISTLPPLGIRFSTGRRGPWITLVRTLSAQSPTGLAMLFAGLALSVVVALEIVAMNDRSRAVADRVAALRQSIGRVAGHPAGDRAGQAKTPGRDEVRDARKIAAAVAVPWGTVLNDLEQARSKDVALLTFDADATSRSLRVSGEAASAADAFAWIKRLSASDGFEDVVINSHEERQVGNRTVFFFTASMLWRTNS